MRVPKLFCCMSTLTRVKVISTGANDMHINDTYETADDRDSVCDACGNDCDAWHLDSRGCCPDCEHVSQCGYCYKYFDHADTKLEELDPGHKGCPGCAKAWHEDEAEERARIAAMGPVCGWCGGSEFEHPRNIFGQPTSKLVCKMCGSLPRDARAA